MFTIFEYNFNEQRKKRGIQINCLELYTWRMSGEGTENTEYAYISVSVCMKWKQRERERHREGGERE